MYVNADFSIISSDLKSNYIYHYLFKLVKAKRLNVLYVSHQSMRHSSLNQTADV
eukprot:UN18814